jgi:hypothetical protein
MPAPAKTVCVVQALLVTGCEALEVRGGGLPPPGLTCTQHLVQCLDTPLSSVPGSNFGQSVCVDCFDICRGNFFQEWPLVNNDFRSCRWWDYTGTWSVPGDAGLVDAE